MSAWFSESELSTCYATGIHIRTLHIYIALVYVHR